MEEAWGSCFVSEMRILWSARGSLRNTSSHSSVWLMRMHRDQNPFPQGAQSSDCRSSRSEIREYTKVQARHGANLRRRLISISRALSILKLVERLFTMRRPGFIEKGG